MNPDPRERYFDNAASTPLDPRVRDEMLPWLCECCGNANSIHAWGRRARAAVEQARARVAAMAGCEPEEIVFTSGATEANNWVAANGGLLAYSPFEHSSVREPCQARQGVRLCNDGWSLAPPPEGTGTAFVMAVNNETGAILTPPSLPPGTRLHRDSAQSLGKFAPGTFPADSASFSAHKIYGPQGVGALYCAGASFPSPILLGGGHEHGHRSGTLNVPGIVGFGAACAVALDCFEDDQRHAQECRHAALEALSAEPGIGHSDHSANSPFVLNVQVTGVHGETIVVDLDSQGFAASSGSACGEGSSDPSTVLHALGMPPREVEGAVRLSFGRFNTLQAARELGEAVVRSVRKARG